MRKQIVLGAVFSGVLMLSGCGSTGPGYVSPGATEYVSTADVGTVKSVRYVKVQDNGAGALVGAAIGAVLGHQVGHGSGKDLATLGGGLAGAYVGNQVAAANAQELTVRLDRGQTVVVVAKGTRFHPGERIRIVRQGSRVVNVEPL